MFKIGDRLSLAMLKISFLHTIQISIPDLYQNKIFFYALSLPLFQQPSRSTECSCWGFSGTYSKWRHQLDNGRGGQWLHLSEGPDSQSTTHAPLVKLSWCDFSEVTQRETRLLTAVLILPIADCLLISWWHAQLLFLGWCAKKLWENGSLTHPFTLVFISLFLPFPFSQRECQEYRDRLKKQTDRLQKALIEGSNLFFFQLKSYRCAFLCISLFGLSSWSVKVRMSSNRHNCTLHGFFVFLFR